MIVNFNTLTPLSYLNNLKQTLQMDIYVKPSLYIQYNNIKPMINESINLFRLSRELYNSNNEFYSFYLPIIIKYFENILSSLLLILSSSSSSSTSSTSNFSYSSYSQNNKNDNLTLLNIIHLLHDIEIHLSDYNLEEMIYLYNIRVLLSLYMFSYNSINMIPFQPIQDITTNSIRSESPQTNTSQVKSSNTTTAAGIRNSQTNTSSERKPRSYSIDNNRSNSTGNVVSTFRKSSYSNRRKISINSNYGNSNNSNNNYYLIGNGQIQYSLVANQMIPSKLRNINSSYINTDVDKYFLFLYHPIRDLYFLYKSKNVKIEKSQFSLFKHYKNYTCPSRFDFDNYYHSNINNYNNTSFSELINIGLLFIEHYRLSELFDLCNYIHSKYGNNNIEEDDERIIDKEMKEKENNNNYFLHFIVADLIVSYLNFSPLYYPSSYSTKKKLLIKELNYEKLKKAVSVCSNWTYSTAIRFYKLSGREEKAVEILLRNDNEFDIARL